MLKRKWVRSALIIWVVYLIRIRDIREICGTERGLFGWVDQRVLKRFGQMERINKESLNKRIQKMEDN